VKWQLVRKDKVKAPTKGDYRQWKAQLSEEADKQCVYCCIHENQFGGIRNFHVEHFKPQSIFPELRNEYSNLFFACGVCNIFKSDDWLGDQTPGDYSTAVYPDPSKVDYSDFLSINRLGKVVSTHTTGRYLIERLHLNRGQMVGLRALRSVFEQLDLINDQVEALMNADAIPASEQAEVMQMLLQHYRLASRYMSARPYGPDQLKAQ
jgi:uncharacterized protein (TIGR02646 family)